MTIGQALKEEQNKLGFTEEEMVHGIISKGAYSRVINNKRNISSEALVKILFKNNIDIADFFSKLKDTYTSSSINIEEKLSASMADAVNNHNRLKVIENYNKIISADVSEYFKKRAKIAVYFFNNNLQNLDKNFKYSILDDLNNNENWVFNVNALKLFSTAMLVLPPQNLEIEISFLFKKISRVKDISEVMRERYATICDNYLHWKYEYLVKNNKQIIIDSNVKKAFDFLEKLKSNAHNVIYIISLRYYSALFTGNTDKAKEIKKNLINTGCTLVVKNWPV